MDPVSNSSLPPTSSVPKTSEVVPLVRLVDDDEAHPQSTAFLLRMSGFEVLAYSSSESFLELDDPLRPGCVVLDLCMPGMNGSELHEALVDKGAHLPVIFLSGHGDVPTAMRAVKRGAVDFLVKPADPRELIEAVRGAVERSLEAHVARQADGEARELVARLTVKEAAVAAARCRGAPQQTNRRSTRRNGRDRQNAPRQPHPQARMPLGRCGARRARARGSPRSGRGATPLKKRKSRANSGSGMKEA